MKAHSINLEDNKYLFYFPDVKKVVSGNEKLKEIIELIERGYTIEQINSLGMNVEEEKFEMLCSMYSERKNILTRDFEELDELLIHISNDCNMRCKYCYGSGGNYNEEKCLMGEIALKETLDKFFYVFPKLKRVQFFGGEPTLNPKIIRQACEVISKEHEEVEICMVSNGIILNEDIIDLIKKYKIKVTYSVDIEQMQNELRPLRNGENSFQIVYENYKKLKRRTKEPIGIEVTYTKKHLENGYSVKNVIKEVQSVFNESTLMFSIVVSEDERFALDNYDSMVNSVMESFDDENKNFYLSVPYIRRVIDFLNGREKVDHFCNCGYGTFAVSAKGDIYPCQTFVGDKKYLCGNIFEAREELKEKLQRIAKEYYEYDRSRNGECKDCYLNNYCKRCMHGNLIQAGDMHKPDERMCKMQKDIFDRVLLCLMKLKTE